jgi:hypothetical protein
VATLFDEKRVVSKAGLDLIHKGWTINFQDSDPSLYQRVKGLILSLLRTEEIEQQFLRVVKQFYITTGKKLYEQLLEFLSLHAVVGEIKSKKEVFKMVNEQSD